MTSKPQSEPQQTGSPTVTAIYLDGITTIRVPMIDANGRHYVREILVRGDNVLSLGRDQA